MKVLTTKTSVFIIACAMMIGIAFNLVYANDAYDTGKRIMSRKYNKVGKDINRADEALDEAISKCKSKFRGQSRRDCIKGAKEKYEKILGDYPDDNDEGDKVPIQNLQKAKARIVMLKSKTVYLTKKAKGQVEPKSCSEILNARACNSREDCTWDGFCYTYRGSIYENDPEPDVYENDIAAYWALMGMGHELNKLGEAIDDAVAKYYTPEFWDAWKNACSMARALLQANEAAKVSAQLPPQGLITPDDFVVFDIELHAVLTDLWCAFCN